MRFRLLLIAVAAMMLLAAPALADLQLRYQARGNVSLPQQQYDYDQYYYYYFDEVTGDGFFIGPDDWWIGNQPYLPYFGYNPPTVDGYYPPYAGSGYGNYDGYYGRDNYPILPAPPLVTPPVMVPPLIARPVTPAPLRFGRRNGGWYIERDPRFQRVLIPRYPDFLTGGSAYYPTPTYPQRQSRIIIIPRPRR